MDTQEFYELIDELPEELVKPLFLFAAVCAPPVLIYFI